ncbi:TolC family protein [Pontibacter arcticus]|uniref:TolC family protein n=2 Tax=Pontibacter arcticus TaxID=2080288 RepID=A0A364RGR1_9BACT|nr:TolC family protein [Pontibacter arcticus]
MQKASLDELNSKYQINEARAAGLPQIDIKGTAVKAIEKTMIALPADFNPEQNGKPLIRPVGTDYNMQAGLSVSQLLFSQSYFVGLKAAKSAADFYRIRTEMTIEDVVYNVGSAYYQVLQTNEQFNSIDANLRRLVQLEKILTLQYENDLAKKVDVNRIKVNRINLENQKKSLQTAYEQQQNILKFFMGMPLEQPLTLVGTAEDNLLTAQPVLVTAEEAAAKRAQFKILNKQKELKSYEMDNVKSGYYPSLSAFGNYNYQSQYDQKLFNPDAMWFPNSQVGLQLNIPVFDGLRKKSLVQQRQIDLRKLDVDIQQFNRNTKVELNNAISQLGNSQSSIQAQEENVKLAQEVYDTTNSLYKEGLSPLTDLLTAETALREAQTNLNNERLKYQIAQLNFLKASGELTTLTK